MKEAQSTATANLVKWVEVDGNAIRHNLAEFRRVSRAPGLMAVVKSNAYGHGLIEAAMVAAESADFLGVNELDEALALTGAGLELPILVLGLLPEGRLAEAVERGYHCVVYDMDRARAFAAAGARLGLKANLHVKLETGLNRQGVRPEDLLDLARFIEGCPDLHFAGLYTHFANIEDTTDHGYAMFQLDNFRKGLSMLEREVRRPDIVHCACSAAALVVPETGFDMIRVGIGMYGLWPSKETRLSCYMSQSGPPVRLRPAMTWKTRIAQVKRVSTGEAIGYGCTEQATHDLRIAVLPVGYYDGLDRGLSNRGQVLVRGRRAYIRGRICMNMCMVDVTHIDDIRAGEEVVLLGRQGDEEIPAEFVASLLGTINYEVVTRVGAHQPRVVV